jgi:NAD+ synthase
VQWLKENMRGLHRSGAVLGISGGIDSSVCLALSVKAFGAERVVPLLLPDKDSDPVSEDLARALAAHYGATPILEAVTPALDGFGCFARRDEAIARVFPEYDPTAGYKAKIVLPSAGRPGEERTPGADGARPDRGGIQLQAAQPHDHALLPCGAP